MLDENDKNYLRSIPGAMEAWEGTRTWEAKLRVCGISGTQVKILPTIAAEYAHAPPSVKELLQQIEKKHNEEYADILKSKLAEVSGNAPQPPQDDPRPSDTKGDDTGPGGDATAAIELTGPESDSVLRQQQKIVGDVKLFDNRTISFLVSEEGHAWLQLNRKENAAVLKKGTKIAGLGGGKVQQLQADMKGVPLEFPLQDKTLIEASLAGQSEDSNEKVRKGSFYVVAKEFLRQFPSETLNVTGHDVKIRQPSQTDTHGFDLCRKTSGYWAFVLKDKAVTRYSSGNAAKQIIDRGVQLHPALGWLWRFQYEKVHSKLTAKKAFLVLLQDLKLTPGRPCKVTRDSPAAA